MQMKRFLLFSIGMVLSLTAGMAVSQALMSSDDLLTEMFSEAGINTDTSNDAKELETLANSKVPFSGLYLYMLQNIMHGPRDAAIEEIAQRYDYTAEQVESIVLKGDVQPIIEKQKTQAAEAQASEITADLEEANAQGQEDVDAFIAENDLSDNTEAYLRWYYETYEQPPTVSDLAKALTTEYLLDWYTTIGDAYDKELVFQQDNRRLAYEALASEMFMNNDLSDSANVDLLYDLDLIHYLLFGELINYPDRSGDTDVETASEDSSGEEVILATESTDGGDSIDPYTCFGDEDLVNALTTYQESPPDTGDALPEEEAAIAYDIDGDGSIGDGSVDSSNKFLVDIEGAFSALDDFLTDMEVAPGNWKRAYPCNDVFCIEVKLISETEDPEVEDSTPMQVDDFEEDQNCIACHTAFIKDRLEETMSKSLVPSKISMNWFEDATCKEAGKFVNLDFNVYVIKKPIDLDTGDEIAEQANKDIDEFKTTLFNLAGLPLPGGTKTVLGKTLNDSACESILSLNDTAGIERSIDDLLGQCQKAAEQNTQAIQEAFDEFVFDTQSQSTSVLYEQVSSELYTLLLYFQTFQEGLKATYETDNPPLPALLNKGYCE